MSDTTTALLEFLQKQEYKTNVSIERDLRERADRLAMRFAAEGGDLGALVTAEAEAANLPPRGREVLAQMTNLAADGAIRRSTQGRRKGNLEFKLAEPKSAKKEKPRPPVGGNVVVEKVASRKEVSAASFEDYDAYVALFGEEVVIQQLASDYVVEEDPHRDYQVLNDLEGAEQDLEYLEHTIAVGREKLATLALEAINEGEDPTDVYYATAMAGLTAAEIQRTYADISDYFVSTRSNVPYGTEVLSGSELYRTATALRSALHRRDETAALKSELLKTQSPFVQKLRRY
jgi:hypothetical protein